MSNTILLKDHNFKSYMQSQEIDEIVENLASSLNTDYKNLNPLFIVVLNGAFIFASDLLKKFTSPCQITCVKYSSYFKLKNIEEPKQILGLNEDITGRHIVIIEDIVDTGNTLESLLSELKTMHPSDVKICTFLFKPKKFTKQYPIHYIGKSIPNDFIIGYGLDYDGYGRNLPCIYQLNN